MNIKRVKYKMSSDDTWHTGYVIGAYEGQNETLLDAKFRYVPKIKQDGKEYLVYDYEDDLDNPMNITVNISI